MNGSARAIMAGDLTRRLPVSGSDDELDRLARGLNEMLARIADLMAGMREVSDNIAHDLRTPLTRLRNHAEEALRGDADRAAYRVALERTIEESDGLIKIFNALLLIARAEAGAERAGMSAFDVGETVASVAELYEPLAEEYGVALKVEAARGLTIVGNRELIGQAVANLIDNALKYGAGEAGEPPAESRSEIAVSARARRRDRRDRSRRPRAGHSRRRPRARDRPLRPAGGRALAPRLRPRPVARRRGDAHARRRGAARRQRARPQGRRHAAGGRSRRFPRRPRRRRHEALRLAERLMRRAAARRARRRAPAPRGATRRARSGGLAATRLGASRRAICCSASPITRPISGG